MASAWERINEPYLYGWELRGARFLIESVRTAAGEWSLFVRPIETDGPFGVVAAKNYPATVAALALKTYEDFQSSKPDALKLLAAFEDAS